MLVRRGEGPVCPHPSVKTGVSVSKHRGPNHYGHIRQNKGLKNVCRLEPNLALSVKLLVNKSIWT